MPTPTPGDEGCTPGFWKNHLGSWGATGLSPTATTIALRAVPAIFGLLTVLLALSLRHVLGATGALVAAGLIAISPGAVYFSRHFIHEALLVCMTLAAVAAAQRIRAAPRLIIPVALTAASAALMFATKETAIISAAVLIAAGLGAVIVRMRGDRDDAPAARRTVGESLRYLMDSRSASACARDPHEAPRCSRSVPRRRSRSRSAGHATRPVRPP